MSYNHQSIESKWQNYWESNKTFFVSDDASGERTYVLDMFPYPSAQGLHVGHPEGYTATDIYTRYLRMNGVNVLHPMGWDAFGLPTENFAIKVGKNPKEVAKQNIENFRRQVKNLGFSYDWSREVDTSNPEYYKWTQWLFLKFYELGLAYQKSAPVNWCPGCQTVLANEQVVAGECERCHSVVEQKQMKQWFFKITDYTEKLLQGLEGLDWPTSILEMQKNWIGKSEGAEVDFKIVIPTEAGIQKQNDLSVKVFTTRLDTIFGATYLVLAPEHELLQNNELRITNHEEVKKYIKLSSQKTELERKVEVKEKTGVKLEGVMAINPANNEEISVFVADYVLMSYGTGAIMAVPAHDARDFAFAKKFNLEVKRVVEPKFVNQTGEAALRPNEEIVKRNAVCVVVRNPENDKYLCVSWKNFFMHGFVTGGVEEGEDIIAAAKREVYEETGYKNLKLVRDPKFALHSFFYHRVKKQNRWARFQYLFLELENDEQDQIPPQEAELHDIVWLSQSELKNFFSVVEGEFTLNFLSDPDYIHTGYGILYNSGKFNNLDSTEAKIKIAEDIGAEFKTQYRLRDWLISRQRYWGAPIPIIYCEKCGAQPVPAKDLPVTLPNDVDFRPTGESPLAKSKSFHSVVCPKCGASAKRESDTMDTFVDSSWYFLRYCDSQNQEKIFDKDKVAKWCPVNFYVGGAEHAVLHLLYARFFTKVLYDLKLINFSEPFLKLRNQGLILGADGQKMSKSLGNVVNPDEIVEKFGADTLRLYEMFMGPLEDAKPWQSQSISGVRRFLDRVFILVNGNELITTNEVKLREIKIWQAKTIKKVTSDIKNFRFNTAISTLMEYVNFLYTVPKSEEKNLALKILLILLSPFAPHLSAELWQGLGESTNIWEQTWPEVDELVLKSLTVTVAVQINGKLRATLEVSPEISEAEVLAMAKNLSSIAKYLESGEIVKIVYVAGRLVNFVVK